MTLGVTIVVKYIQDDFDRGIRISVLQGGTRSSKTHSACQWFIQKLIKENNKVLSIVRESLPSIKGSVMRDFFEILEKMGIYDERCHNKTENTYMIGSNLVEFISCDQAHKIRGRKRNFLLVNEATEIEYESWMQLIFRTEEFVVLDYNPSPNEHWIYDHVLTRNDAALHIVTYKDNPFLPDELVKEIERLEIADEDNWKIFGLGQRGSGRQIIFNHQKLCKELPEGDDCTVYYGLDFGFTHVTALVKCVNHNNAVYVQELIYESGLTTSDLATIMRGHGIGGYIPIYYDYADPRSAEALEREGFRMIPCASKDVKQSIMTIKSKPLFITEDSSNLIKELRNYSWKKDKATGKLLDEPVKFMDDAVDALRYAVSTNEGAFQFAPVAC